MARFQNWFAGNLEPNPPSDYTPKEGKRTKQAIANTLAKRPKFAKQTRIAMQDRFEKSGNTKTGIDPGGKGFLQVPCKSCGGYGAAGEMQLGHEVNWRDWANRFGPLCEGAVRAAFNDLENLEWEHTVCNVSHIFESMSADAIQAYAEQGWDGLSADVQSALYGRAERSGAFSDDPDALADELKSAATLFQALRTRHTPSDEELYQDVFGHGVDVNGEQRVIVTPEEPTSNGSSDVVAIDALTRPKWKRETYAALYSIWKANGWITTGQDNIEYYRCGSCGNWGEGHAMQLGHELDWKTFIAQSVGFEENGVWYAEKGLARMAYADLTNLKYEHQSCNVSHDWEGLNTAGAMGPDYNPKQRVEEMLEAYQHAFDALSDRKKAEVDVRFAELDFIRASTAFTEVEARIDAQLDDSTGLSGPQVQALSGILETYRQEARQEFTAAEQALNAAKQALGQKDNVMCRQAVGEMKTVLTQATSHRRDAEGLHERFYGSREATIERRVTENEILITHTAQQFLLKYQIGFTDEQYARVRARAQREEEAVGFVMSH